AHRPLPHDGRRQRVRDPRSRARLGIAATRRRTHTGWRRGASSTARARVMTMSDQSAAGPTPKDDLTLEQWAAMPEDEPGELVDGRLEEEEMPDFADRDLARTRLPHVAGRTGRVRRRLRREVRRESAPWPEAGPQRLSARRWAAAASWPGPRAARRRGRGDLAAAGRCPPRPPRQDERLCRIRGPLVLADRSGRPQFRDIRPRC